MEILKVIHGSRAYGTVTPTSDTDIRSVFIASERDVIGPWKYDETRRVSGDADETAFELRKFISLASAQNPNVLEILFVPMDCMLDWTAEGSLMRAQAAKFLSRRIAVTYAGFADSCLKRLTSGHTHTGIRAEIDKYGWDTKMGMHAVRVLEMGIETLRTGWMNVRRDNANKLLNIRRGAYPQQYVMEWISELQKEIRAVRDDSPLPDDIDRAWAADLCVQLTKNAWERQREET